MLPPDFTPVDVPEEDITVVSDGHGNDIPCIEMAGHHIPSRLVKKGMVPNPKANWPRLKKLELRSDDVFLIAYPKAGTHWVAEIIHMLLKGKAEYDTNTKEKYMYEFQTPQSLGELPSPRIFNSHLSMDLLPSKLAENNTKLVFLQRNPRDVSVSFYKHIQHLGKEDGYSATFDQYMDMFMADKVIHQSWCKYTLNMEKDLPNYPAHLQHSMYYEDIKLNPVEQVKRLATFLSCGASDQLVDEIVEKCNINKLRQANVEVKKAEKWQMMYRKGIIGDWKSWFTVARNEQFEEFLQTNMSKSKFEYIYESK